MLLKRCNMAQMRNSDIVSKIPTPNQHIQMWGKQVLSFRFWDGKALPMSKDDQTSLNFFCQLEMQEY